MLSFSLPYSLSFLETQLHIPDVETINGLETRPLSATWGASTVYPEASWNLCPGEELAVLGGKCCILCFVENMAVSLKKKQKHDLVTKESRPIAWEAWCSQGNSMPHPILETLRQVGMPATNQTWLQCLGPWVNWPLLLRLSPEGSQPDRGVM